MHIINNIKYLIRCWRRCVINNNYYWYEDKVNDNYKTKQKTSHNLSQGINIGIVEQELIVLNTTDK